jgi:glycosyltransferase involved in cell wall biosynthesis
MHIALFSPAWPFGYPNGIVSYVHYLRIGLEQLGHKVSIITLKVTSSITDHDVHVVEKGFLGKIQARLSKISGDALHATAWVAPAISSKLHEIHARQAIDILEIEESFGWFSEIARRVPFPVITKLHGPAYITQKLQAVQPANLRQRIDREAAALRSHPHICSPSNDTLNQTRVELSVVAAQAEVLVNPVDCAIDERFVWQAHTCDADRILFVGRFDGHKGGDVVILAFKQILQSRPDARLTFIGPNSGAVIDDGEPLDIHSFIKKNIPAHQIEQIELTGPLKGDEISVRRTKAAVTVVASRWENQPNTLLEAMVQGCPVVAANTAGIPEVVRHGVDGLLVKCADPAEFAAACLTLMQDQELSRSLGAQARLNSLARYEPRVVALANLAYYARVVARHH